MISRILSLPCLNESAPAKPQKAFRFVLLSSLFFISFIATSLVSCLITPPFQTPDEPAHFLRAVQISEGHLVGEKFGTTSGGKILESAKILSRLFQEVEFNPLRKANITQIDAFNSIRWGSLEVEASFPNTVAYGPILYLPSAIAVFMTRHQAWSVLQSYYTARVFNALVFLSLATFALAIAQRGKMLALLLLSLPMTASLATSLSQDSLLIATSALLAAVLTRHQISQPWSWFKWGMMGVGFSLLAMAKPPYLALSAIACCVSGRRDFLPSLMCPVVAGAITLAWLMFGVAPVLVHFASAAGVSEAAQTSFVASHPAAFVLAIINTLLLQWTVIAKTFIGVLGWLDAELPQYYYNVAETLIGDLILGGLAIGLLIDFSFTHYWAAVRFFGVLLALLLSVLGIFFSLYVIWTPVGASLVSGIQGRYFIPLAFFLMILMPNLKPLKAPSLRIVIEQLSLLISFLWLGLSSFVFAQTLVLRFWLS